MAWDWQSSLGGAASGAAAGTAISPGWGTAIGGLAGGALGGFLDTEPKTNFWDNYRKELDKLRGQYTRQASQQVRTAAEQAQRQTAKAGLTGQVRQGIVKAQMAPAFTAAAAQAQRDALATAATGSYMTQNDYSDLWKGLAAVGYAAGQRSQQPATATTSNIGTPTVATATGGVAPSDIGLYPGNANYPAAPVGTENYATLPDNFLVNSPNAIYRGLNPLTNEPYGYAPYSPMY